jgi:hypothetical protein
MAVVITPSSRRCSIQAREFRKSSRCVYLMCASRPRRTFGCSGRERKERVCPLWPQTAEIHNALLAERGDKPLPEDPLFRNHRGFSLTRFGVRYILRKHCARAQAARPAFGEQASTPPQHAPLALRYICSEPGSISSQSASGLGTPVSPQLTVTPLQILK